MKFFGAAALALLGGAAAQAADSRIVVDPNTPPWNAVAKVQTNIGTRCSGVLIAPAVVLTAAHCLYNPRTRAMLQAVSLHVLFGFERERYRWHRAVTRVSLGPGFDPLRRRPQSSDWVRLKLTESVPVPPLPMTGGLPLPGTAVALAGYNQDRTELQMAAHGCHLLHVEPQRDGAAFLVHNCAGTFGTSGGPILAQEDHRWAVAGINIAASAGKNLGLAVPLRQAVPQASKP